MQVSGTAVTPHRTHRHHWWKEVLIIGVFYAVYSAVRNQFGSNRVGDLSEPVHAFNNAVRVIDLERALRLFHEPTIQRWFLPYHGFIQFWNTFYGTAHFFVTVLAFWAMFTWMPARFARWRNTLAFTTALALIGFSLFPLMPPRLLNAGGPFGGERIAVERALPDYGFVDTLDDYGGPWNFDSGTMQKVSNQYAAMPSLHIAWSTWCTIVFWPLRRRWPWLVPLLVLYPLATLFCIIVTANHFWLDGFGGLITLTIGIACGTQLDRWNQTRLARKLPAAVDAVDALDTLDTLDTLGDG